MLLTWIGCLYNVVVICKQQTASNSLSAESLFEEQKTDLTPVQCDQIKIAKCL